jgi:GAF domain-containing protein
MATDFNSHHSSQPLKDYYQTLYQAALTISSSLELDEVLQKVVKSITEAMGAKASVLRLLDTESQQLYLGAQYGLNNMYLDKEPVAVDSSPIDKEELHSCCPVYIPDVRVDPRFRYREIAKREGLVSALCVPLEIHGSAIGVLRVYTGEPATFTEQDVQFLTVLASLSAAAIENARLYESVRGAYHGVIDAFWGNTLSLETI